MQFPIKIASQQRIDAALLIPGIKAGLVPYDNPTKFPKLWPAAQVSIGTGGIKCDLENHGSSNATARLVFNTIWQPPSQNADAAQHEVLLEPIDAGRTRTLYLANWCRNLSVNVVIPQTATGRFVEESSDQEREIHLLGRDHGQSMGLGAFSQGAQVCN